MVARELGGGGALSGNGGDSALLLRLTRDNETKRMKRARATVRHGAYVATIA